jgi:tetratricopeptide (TPR) repeat protein
MASLVVAGYYVDPTVHDEFGDSTAEMLQEAAGFALAARLTPWMGSTPSVLIGLLGGIVRYAWSARTLRVHPFGSIVLSFVGVCAARSSVANLRLEPHTHELLLRLLAPAKRLSKHNAVRLVYDLIAIGLAEGKGAFGDVHDGFVDQLDRLPHVRTITTESRHHYEAGVLCGLGRCHLFRGGFGALGCADRVDAMGGQHDRILAQFLRRSHYLYRGETAEADKAEEVLDTLAAQYGYRWAADFLAVMDFVPYHLCADIVALKRVLHRTEQAIALAPAFVTYRDVIRAMYECHRGRPEVALALYERLGPQLRPFSHPAWSFACANRAECLNGLGRHEEALAACREALRLVGGLARVYVVAYQQLEREGALALAALGRTDEAARQLDELLTLHEHDSNPLIVGLLHRDRARIALMADDPRAFERHARATHAEFSRTGNPTLQSQGHRLVEWALAPESGEVPNLPSESKDNLQLLQSVAGSPLDVVAQRALEHIVALSGAPSARMYLIESGRPILYARHGDERSAPPLETEVQRMLAAFHDQYARTKTTSAFQPTPEETTGHTLLPLVVTKDGAHHTVGAVVIFECRQPERLTRHHLQQIAIALRSSAITAVDR